MAFTRDCEHEFAVHFLIYAAAASASPDHVRHKTIWWEKQSRINWIRDHSRPADVSAHFTCSHFSNNFLKTDEQNHSFVWNFRFFSFNVGISKCAGTRRCSNSLIALMRLKSNLPVCPMNTTRVTTLRGMMGNRIGKGVEDWGEKIGEIRFYAGMVVEGKEVDYRRKKGTD